MDKLRRLCGSKSITGYRDKDLSKRDYSLSSRIVIFSILILLLFALTIQSGSSAPDPTYFFEGYDSWQSKWQRSNICCYLEGDCVPCRVIVDNTKPAAIAETITEQIFYDYNSEPDYSGKLGVVGLENFNLPGGTTSGPCYNVIPGGVEIYYWWNYTIPANQTWTMTYCARLSHECSQYPGASLHGRIEQGNKDISIKLPTDTPDLYATKSANVICNAITYTISYANRGTQNQTNTVLVDDYDETKVTVTNAGGGTDNGSAITWAIGNLAIGASGTKSYSVSLKPGVAGGTAIINNGTITGDFAEKDTTDNSYTVTSSAKVNPVANFTSNSPQIYCYNITFNGTATGGTPDYTYHWDFCDGNSSTEQNPSHRYSAPGTYDVTLTVTDANGCTNSTTKPVVASGYTAGLSITKEANVTSATVGTVIGYTINVSNTGNVNLTSVLVTDSLTGLSQTIPNLTPGALQTFNTTHTVTESEICDPISNIATANGTDPCGVAVGPVHASVSVTQWYNTGLSVIKNTNVTSATVGTVIVYTINVNNTGNVNLTNVLVTDSLTGLSETIPILAPAASQIFNTTHTVTESDLCGIPPRIENTATANGTDPCGYLTGTAQGIFSVSGGYTATLSITKEANVT
ncbi:MAG: PKD domain-containing protein [Euryarchaeota archaeon]|nr:PKD domain-containing protein [Euryarchaeota archaeon]